MDLTMMERVGDRWGKMEGSCSTGQGPQWAVVPVEKEEEEVYRVTFHVLLSLGPNFSGIWKEVVLACYKLFAHCSYVGCMLSFI
jgi:hypothetical protein